MVFIRNHESVFPDSSTGKESACNAGDPSLIPGSGRSAGEGIDYPLQYSWASLVAQLVKSLPAMWETWVRSLGWDNPQGREGCPLQYSGLEISWTVQPMGSQRAGRDWAAFTSLRNRDSQCERDMKHINTEVEVQISLICLWFFKKYIQFGNS